MGKVIKFSGRVFHYSIEHYVGCYNRCAYCWNKNTFIDKIGVIPRVMDKLEEDLNTMNLDRIREVNLCCTTDPYQRAEEKTKITRQIIEKLIEYDVPYTVQTKSTLALRDIDLFKTSRCQIGTTILSLDDKMRKELEPNASTIDERIDMIETLAKERIPTFVFIKPILPDTRPIGIVSRLIDYVGWWGIGLDYRIVKTNAEWFYYNIKDLMDYLWDNEIRHTISPELIEFIRVYGAAKYEGKEDDVEFGQKIN